MVNTSVLNPTILEKIRQLGGEELLRRLVHCFFAYAPERFSKLQNAIQQNDMEKVEFFAHSLKSSAGNIGAFHLLSLLNEIEIAAGNKNGPLILDSLETLNLRYAEFLDALSQVLASKIENSV